MVLAPGGGFEPNQPKNDDALLLKKGWWKAVYRIYAIVRTNTIIG